MLMSDEGRIRIGGQDAMETIADYMLLTNELASMGGLSALEFLDMVKALIEKADSKLGKSMFDVTREDLKEMGIEESVKEEGEWKRGKERDISEERSKSEVFDFSEITKAKKRYRR